MKSMWLVLGGACIITGLNGCSLENPAKNGGLRIVIEDTQKHLASLLPFPGSKGRFRINMTAPTTTSDFDCFAANITGSGISGDSEDLIDCSSPSNFNGKGAGILTDLFVRGEAVEVEIPTGDRTIDIYGIYPSDGIPECGGDGSNSNVGEGYAYYVGGKTVAIKEPTSVVIPISFSSRPADIVCSGDTHGSLVLVPDGTAAKGRAFVKACGDSSTFGSDTPSTAGTEFTAGEYASLSDLGGSAVAKTCNSGFSDVTQTITYVWDLSAYDTFAYDEMYVHWYGAAGVKGSGCSTGPTSVSPDASNSMMVQIWNDTNSAWEDIGPIGTTVALAGNYFSPSYDYIDSSNKIYIRANGGGANPVPSNCSLVETDFVKLELVSH